VSALKFCGSGFSLLSSGLCDRPRFENQHGYHLYRFLPHGAVSTKWVINKTFDPHTNMALAWIKQQILPEGEVTWRCLSNRAWDDHTLLVQQGAVILDQYVDSRDEVPYMDEAEESCCDHGKLILREDGELVQRLRTIAKGRS